MNLESVRSLFSTIYTDWTFRQRQASARGGRGKRATFSSEGVKNRMLPSRMCGFCTRQTLFLCPGASAWHPNQNRRRHQPSPVPLLRPRSCSLTGHRLEASSLALSSLLSWRRSRIRNRDWINDSPISKRISKGPAAKAAKRVRHEKPYDYKKAHEEQATFNAKVQDALKEATDALDDTARDPTGQDRRGRG